MGPAARRRVSTAIVAGVVCGLVPLVALTLSPTAADAVTAGFTEQTVVTGLDQPMAVEFSEDGRVFVAEKSGLIKVFDGLGDTSPTTFADLRSQVYNQTDRGVMSLALAPTFPVDPSVYVLYTHDAATGATDDGCPLDDCVISGRLSKLNAALDGGGPERVLVEDWCQQYPSHSVGELAFGPDGYLYASGGAVPTVPPHSTYNQEAPVITGAGCGGSSTSGVAIYQGGQYPAEYDGALFFADYSRQSIWVMFPGADGGPDPATRRVFRESGAFPVDLQIGPNGDLYYVDGAAGEVRRIRHASGNQPPIAVITADPDQGGGSLTVSFSATGSSDPEGAALTYAWDLDDDGAFDDAIGVTAIRTYSVAGAYDAAVQVSDPSGQSDVATRRILAGTTAPTATIETPSQSSTWTVGDTISFSGSALDPEDGALPASALSWTVVLHDCATIDSCDEHRLAVVNGVALGVVAAPDHDYPAYLELRLTATDATGVATTVSRRLDPQVSSLTIETSPPGLSVTVSGTRTAAPYIARGIVGSRLTLSAPARQTIGSSTYEFIGWSDNGGRVHDIVVAGIGITYRAIFTRTSGAD